MNETGWLTTIPVVGWLFLHDIGTCHMKLRIIVITIAAFLPSGIWAETPAGASDQAVADGGGDEVTAAAAAAETASAVTSAAETRGTGAAIATASGRASQDPEPPKSGKRSPMVFLRKISPFKRRGDKASTAFETELGLEAQVKKGPVSRFVDLMGFRESRKKVKTPGENVVTRAVRDVFGGMSEIINGFVRSWPVAPGRRGMRPLEPSTGERLVDVSAAAVPLLNEAELQRTGMKIAWKKTGLSTTRLVSVRLAGNVVVVETAARELIALDLVSGKQVWVFEAGEALNTGPVVTEDGVFLVAGDILYSITKAELGVYDWRRPLTFAATTEPVPYGKFLVFGSSDGRIQFYNRKLRDVEYTAYCRGNLLPGPVVEGTSMTFTTTEGLVYQIGLDNRKFEWKFAEVQRTASSSPALDGRLERPRVVFGTEEQYLVAVDYGSGRMPRVGDSELGRYWEVLLSGPITQRPMLQGKGLVLAIADGSGLHAVNSENAEEAWFTAGVTRVLASGATEIYCATEDRQLVAVDAKTGQIRWRQDLTPFEFVPDALGRLMVVLATNSGDVYALVPPAAGTPREDVEDLRPAAEPKEEEGGGEEPEAAPVEKVDEEVAPDEEL